MGFKETLIQIINIAISPELQRELFPIKVIFIFFGATFFLTIVYFMFNSTFLKYKFIIDLTGFFNIEPASARRARKRWAGIRQRFEAGTESEYKLAVIEADALLNDVLEDKGFAGKNFDEKIEKVGKTQIPNPDEVISAHKIRNNIVHDPNYKLTKEEVKQVIAIYEKTIKDVESF